MPATNPLLKPKILRFDHRSLTTEQQQDAACAHGEEMFARHGECMPTWIINAVGRAIWIETIWRSDREKYVMTALMASMLQELHADAYTLMVEAWVAVDKTDPDGKPAAKQVLPSERPKHERDDVLMINTQPRFGKMLMSRYLVTIRNHGLNFLGPRQDEDWSKGEGEMANLFKRRT